MEEKIFFESDGIKITNTILVVGNEVYAVSKITSFRVAEEPIGNIGTGVTFLVSVVLLAYSLLFGILVLCGMLFYLYKKSPIYKFLITTSSGETTVFATQDKLLVDGMVNGLSDAFI